MIINYATAVSSLNPSAQFVCKGDGYENLHVTNGEKPSKEVLDAEIERLQTEWDSLLYQRKRAGEYPPITDYLDGVAKGDQAQIQAYIDACLAVKAKYPKPEGV